MNNEIRIRNVDAAVSAKLSQLAKKKGVSRNVYIKKHLESLAVLGELKKLETKYERLLNETIECIEKNNQLLEQILKKENEK